MTPEPELEFQYSVIPYGKSEVVLETEFVAHVRRLQIERDAQAALVKAESVAAETWKTEYLNLKKGHEVQVRSLLGLNDSLESKLVAAEKALLDAVRFTTAGPWDDERVTRLNQFLQDAYNAAIERNV